MWMLDEGSHDHDYYKIAALMIVFLGNLGRLCGEG